MVKIDRNKLKQITKMCILEENKICDNCCECFVCDLDPSKTCDNCAKCLELAEYNSIVIEDILLTENPFTYKNGKKSSSRDINCKDNDGKNNKEKDKGNKQEG